MDVDRVSDKFSVKKGRKADKRKYEGKRQIDR